MKSSVLVVDRVGVGGRGRGGGGSGGGVGGQGHGVRVEEDVADTALDVRARHDGEVGRCGVVGDVRVRQNTYTVTQKAI